MYSSVPMVHLSPPGLTVVLCGTVIPKKLKLIQSMFGLMCDKSGQLLNAVIACWDLGGVIASDKHRAGEGCL